MASRQPAKTRNKLKVFKCLTITKKSCNIFISIQKEDNTNNQDTIKKAFFVKIKTVLKKTCTLANYFVLHIHSGG